MKFQITSIKTSNKILLIGAVVVVTLLITANVVLKIYAFS